MQKANSVLYTGVRVSDLKMKSCDLPILQFFSRKSPEPTHEMVEEVDDEDESDDSTILDNAPHEVCLSKQSDEDSSNTSITCPVCQKLLLGDNDRINKHIDLCLNGEMVRTTIKEQEQQTSPQHSTISKRFHISTQTKLTPPAKRQRKKDLTPQRNNSIAQYFSRTDSK